MGDEDSISVVVVAVFFIESVHEPDVHEDEDQEDINGPLLCEPEAERKSAKGKIVQKILEQNSGTVGGQKPDTQQHKKIFYIFLPIGRSLFLIFHF